MANPLTTEQQTFIDDLSSAFQEAKAALVAAIKADNDPLHNLGDARDRNLALRNASTAFSVLAGLGGQPWGTPRSNGSVLRSPPERGAIQMGDTPSVTV